MPYASLNETSILTLPDVNRLNPRSLGLDERWFRSLRSSRAPELNP